MISVTARISVTQHQLKPIAIAARKRKCKQCAIPAEYRAIYVYGGGNDKASFPVCFLHAAKFAVRHGLKVPEATA